MLAAFVLSEEHNIKTYKEFLLTNAAI